MEFHPDGFADGTSTERSAEYLGSGSIDESGDIKKSPARRPGVADPGDFMAQFRKLRVIKEKAAKAAAAGPVRRVVFGDLPEWATISRILLLTHGGAIEKAWVENDTVVVQFVEENECVDYHEKHSDGIKYLAADGNEAVITVTMPEEGLPDNAELANRVAEGASRVVCLEGLAAGFKAGDDVAVLGILAQPGWEGMKFERILVTQAEVSSMPKSILLKFVPLLTVYCRLELISPSLSTISMMAGSSCRISRRESMIASLDSGLTRKLTEVRMLE